MTPKSSNDFTQQNILIAKIQLVVATLDSIDELLERTPQEQSRCDSLKSDYIHMYENYDLSEAQMIDVSKRLHNVCVERRNWNNIYLIGNTYKNNINKLLYPNQREFFKHAMEMTIKNLNQDYKDRVLDEQEKSEILGSDDEPTIKKGRGYIKLSDEEKARCLNMISDGAKPKDIVEEFGISVATMYKWRKELLDDDIQ